MSMKRIYILLLTAVISLPLWAQEPTALWGKAVQGNGTAMGGDIKPASDGSLYVCGSVGTKTAEDVILFGNDVIAAPASVFKGKGSTSITNLFVSKMTQTGTPLWTVCSRNGDVETGGSGKQFLLPVNDGVIVAFSMHHGSGHYTDNILLIDASGTEVSLDWVLESESVTRYYKSFVMKISNAGVIQWVRSLSPVNQKDALSLCSLLADNEGNLWIGGNVKEAFSLLKADGTTMTVAPSFAGGDMLMMQLDKNGYYKQHLQLEGTATKVNLCKMACSGGKLYVVGLLKGTAGSPVSLGGKSLTPDNDYANPFVAALSSDGLMADFLRLYPVRHSKDFGVSILNIGVGSDALWLASYSKGALMTKSGKTVSTENWTYAGMLLKVDKETGELLDGYVKGYGEQGVGLNQGGFYAAFEGRDGRLYALEYWLNKRMSMQIFDRSDLQSPVSSWEDMIGYTSSAQNVVLTADGKMFVLARGNKSDPNTGLAPNPLYGGTVFVEQTSVDFSVLVCAFQLPVKPYAPVTAGDADGDGAVTAADVVEIASYLTGKPSASFVFEAADMNGDGKVDVSDVLQMIAVMTAK